MALLTRPLFLSGWLPRADLPTYTAGARDDALGRHRVAHDRPQGAQLVPQSAGSTTIATTGATPAGRPGRCCCCRDTHLRQAGAWSHGATPPGHIQLCHDPCVCVVGQHSWGAFVLECRACFGPLGDVLPLIVPLHTAVQHHLSASSALRICDGVLLGARRCCGGPAAVHVLFLWLASRTTERAWAGSRLDRRAGARRPGIARAKQRALLVRCCELTGQAGQGVAMYIPFCARRIGKGL